MIRVKIVSDTCVLFEEREARKIKNLAKGSALIMRAGFNKREQHALCKTAIFMNLIQFSSKGFTVF